MPFDAAPSVTVTARARRGRAAYRAGLGAEDAVARHYARGGYRPVARRWRGPSGELDLVCADGAGGLVIVEVKKAPDFDTALSRLGPRQLARLCAATDEYLAVEGQPLTTPLRLDLAVVDGLGRIATVENITQG